MAVKIRLARGGRKNHPHYKIIVANSSAPRDGRFIEKVGFYNPLLPNTHAQHIDLKNDRIEYWLQQGAQPTDRVIRFLMKAGITLPAKLSAKVAIKLKSRKPKPPKSKEKA